MNSRRLWSQFFLLFIGFILSICIAAKRSALSDIWQLYSDSEFDNKLLHAELYQETLEGFNYSAGKLTMLEIGVTSGRSMLSWIKWFEDVQSFVYVGINATPFVKMLDISDEDTIHIETRSDLDAAYLNDLCSRYGPFDIIVDNSDHSGEVRIAALKSLYSCMSESSHYFIELDMSFAGSSDSSRLIVAQAAELFRLLHFHWTKDESFIDPIFSSKVKNVQLMHDLIAIERSNVPAYTEVYRGSERIPSDSIAGLNYVLENNLILNINLDISDRSATIPHEQIKEKCRQICAEHPSILAVNGVDLEGCARGMKHDALATVFRSSDPFLVGVDLHVDSHAAKLLEGPE